MEMKIYALYHGEENLMDGTIKEIAKKRDVKTSMLYYLLSAAYKRRCEKSKRPHLELVEIEEG